MREVPITYNFDQTRPEGWAQISPVIELTSDFLSKHVLAPAYRVNNDGTVELIELSWIATARAPYIKRKQQSGPRGWRD